MFKILKYSILDLLRSHWSTVYFLFYITLGYSLLFFNSDLSKTVITLTNVIIVLTPLIGTLLGVMYYYHSREFTTLLLSQPIKRSTIFIGQYLGLSISLSISLLVGLGIPFLSFGLFRSNESANLIAVLSAGIFLSFIFCAIAMNIAIANTDRIKGFGYSILSWLFLAVIYDGIFVLLLISFSDYPLERFTLAATLLNPIDLSRIFIILNLDIAALLGYTGAVLYKYFGGFSGKIISLSVMILWVVLPVISLKKLSDRKDF